MKGDSVLRNCEDNSNLLEIVPTPEDDKEAESFRETLAFQTCGIFRRGSRLYRPRSVMDICGQSARHMSSNDIVFTLSLPDQDIVKDVIFERIDDAPLWITGHTEPASALKEFLEVDRNF